MLLEYSLDLSFLGVHAGRQQAGQSERLALGFGERCGFIQLRVVKHFDSVFRPVPN